MYHYLKELSGPPVYNEEQCASLCHTHNPSSPPCTFFAVDTSGKCLLGNLDNGTSSSYTGSDNSYTVFYNESKAMFQLPLQFRL